LVAIEWRQAVTGSKLTKDNNARPIRNVPEDEFKPYLSFFRTGLVSGSLAF